MAQAEFNNILVIHFGQLGDVVLGLPALRAIREHFANRKITLLVGRSTEQVAKLGEVADEYISVDRIALRDGNKVRSISQIVKLVKDVRNRKFDLVIDLHSLYETNLLGYLSGAKTRLYAQRDRRSIDRLSNFPVKPPAEDRSMHHADRYLDVIKALGINDVERKIVITPLPDATASAQSIIYNLGIDNKELIGFFMGAGHHSRRWPLGDFVGTAERLKDPKRVVLVFLGPEERELRQRVEEEFAGKAVVVPELPLNEFFAMLSKLAVLVSGDTGPMHLGAAAGAGIVLLSQKGAPDIFRPLAERLVVIDDRDFDEITVDQVANAVVSLLEK